MANTIFVRDWKGDVIISFYNIDLTNYHKTIEKLYTELCNLIEGAGSLLDIIQLKPVIEVYRTLYKDEVGYKKLMHKINSIIEKPKETW